MVEYGADKSRGVSEFRGRAYSTLHGWYVKSKDKPPIEKIWLAVETCPNIYNILYLLESLAFEYGEKKRVLSTLNKLFDEKKPIQRPQISYLMCKMGDLSKIPEIGRDFFKGQFQSGVGIKLPDDSCAGLNAEFFSLRQLILYGDNHHHKLLKKHIRSKNVDVSYQDEITMMLIDFGLGMEKFPSNYDKKKFPLQLLICLLDYGNQEQWSYYQAAEAVQKLSGIDFGYRKQDAIEEKNEAVKNILFWWNHEKQMK